MSDRHTKDIALNKEKNAHRMKLWWQGYSDPEIAAKVGDNRQVIAYWRRARGLEANVISASLSIREDARRYRLWGKGYTDRQIAREVGVKHIKTIMTWRESRGLEANRAGRVRKGRAV